jgi:RNA polymerase sigma-70 factor (ECF subfamily)
MDEGNNTSFLVLRAQSGDRQALDELLKGCQSQLYGYLLRLLSNSADAEDALQTTFLQVFRKLRWLRDPALFRPWTYRIANRIAQRMLKRRGNYESTSTPYLNDMADDNESIDFGMLEMKELIPELLERLTAKSREVVVLHYLEEFTVPQVASILGIPVGTAKSRLSYALACLRNTSGQSKGRSNERR